MVDIQMPSGSSVKNLTIVGLVLALLGVITPILLDWSRSRSLLELQVDQGTSIVSKTRGLEKLEIKYDGKIVSSLSKFSFILINKGSRPIVQTEIIKPPTIVFSKGSHLLDIQVDNKIPKDLIANATYDYKNNSIVISFPLLNPGDQVAFSGLVSGDNPSYETACRIYGIKEMSVVDKSTGRGNVLTWQFYVVSLCFLLTSMGLFPIIIEFQGAKRALRKLNGDMERLLGFENKKQYVNYIKNIPFYFPYKTETIKKVNALIIENKDQLKSEVSRAIIDQVNYVIRINKIALYIIPMLMVLSGVYVLTNIAKLISL